ncbi:hypothetical protein MYCTH_2131097 [Thermothelomyces thermophilus ATCC 42464]|uniref:Uncharacterized protein n=1 Tax=Thermothelomyces thermophilus (strain ATCC 42464 / BCRC 31852 / DSM 1799) TaxID=573729 RepID=G2QN40_THET4|nr:uncharacterized protein MYCTH_2131097 [Thermothelomyces thermophilus ATCC 42464]AEO61913.1 hypothetical protein MYCTH_2131097 [Thermothelomyces thermophilus ATCC 42464]
MQAAEALHYPSSSFTDGWMAEVEVEVEESQRRHSRKRKEGDVVTTLKIPHRGPRSRQRSTDQSQEPYGGFTPNFATSKFTDFHVGGDSISTRTTHPQGSWLYHITLDSNAAGN